MQEAGPDNLFFYVAQRACVKEPPPNRPCYATDFQVLWSDRRRLYEDRTDSHRVLP